MSFSKQSYKTRMYEKEINLIDVLSSTENYLQGMCSMGSQNAPNRFWWGMAGGPMSLAVWPMIFRLLGHWPAGKKFQNDHCSIQLYL